MYKLHHNQQRSSLKISSWLQAWAASPEQRCQTELRYYRDGHYKCLQAIWLGGINLTSLGLCSHSSCYALHHTSHADRLLLGRGMIMGILLVFQLLVFLSNLPKLLPLILLYMSWWHFNTVPIPTALAETPPKAPLAEPFLISDPGKILQINHLDQLWSLRML